MLAVRSAMDALHRSTSFGSDREILIRQPSAEDLDAAHQLVSSARGERHGSRITPANEPATDNAHMSRVSPIPETTDAPRSSSEVSEQREDATGLAQVCRYATSLSTMWE